MKKILIATILGLSILGTSSVYSQDSTKAKMKSAKMMKKTEKGKGHKAMKKDYKADKKEVKAK